MSQTPDTESIKKIITILKPKRSKQVTISLFYYILTL